MVKNGFIPQNGTEKDEQYFSLYPREINESNNGRPIPTNGAARSEGVIQKN